MAMIPSTTATAKLAELESRLPEGATVMPIVVREKPLYEFPRQGMLQNHPFQHVHHHAAANRGAVMLNNWNAHYPGMPIRFRDAVDPYRQFDPVKPTLAGLSAYEASIGRKVEVILITGLENHETIRIQQAIRQRLNREYCLEQRAGSFGLLILRKDANAACRPPEFQENTPG